MTGAICGDIIGSVFEWHNVKSEGFALFCRESRFTDDTVMNIAVADKLLNCENKHGLKYYSSTALEYAARYKQYYTRYPGAGFGQMFSDWAKSNDFAKQISYGNGAAMRAVPIGYAFDNINAVLKEARLSCVYTHNNNEAIKGAKAVAGCVFLANNGVVKNEISKFITNTIGYKLDFTINGIRSEYNFNSRANYSVPPAIRAFLESEDYESAVRKAISIGGDSDTIACIAGGIAHAYYKEIPKSIYDKCMLMINGSMKTTVNEFCKKYNVALNLK